jgi:hypothetical protein
MPVKIEIKEGVIGRINKSSCCVFLLNSANDVLAQEWILDHFRV